MTSSDAHFPTARLRRLRHNPLVRQMVRETALAPDDFILPLFVRPGRGVRNEIASMPGNYQLSVDRLVDEVGAAADLGVRAFILFGIPQSKDATGSSAWQDDGIVQQALRALRAAYKQDILLITDECFCEYTDHGHCGTLSDRTGRLDLDNDATLPNLAAQCVSHARAGADVVMVKPALAYLDIIRRVKERFGVPTAAYNVSGEFAMVKAAAAKGWIDERRVAMEILTSIKRAGADMILTYHARDAARWLK